MLTAICFSLQFLHESNRGNADHVQTRLAGLEERMNQTERIIVECNTGPCAGAIPHFPPLYPNTNPGSRQGKIIIGCVCVGGMLGNQIINGSEPMQTDQAYFFSDIFLIF